MKNNSDDKFLTNTVIFSSNPENTLSYKGMNSPTIQTVRGEFLSGTFNPKVTFTRKTIIFNPSCVRFFSDYQHISITIDAQNRRLFVKPVVEGDAGKLKIAHFKNGKPIAQTCATNLCRVLFDFMKWDINAKYRVIPKFEGCDTEIMILPLDDVFQIDTIRHRQ